MVDLSIIIPAFNEALRITPTIEKFNSFLIQQNVKFELVVVDDGSTDNTQAVVNSLAWQLPNLRVIVSEKNRGKGHAVRLGMLAAVGKIRLFTDADGSTPVEELPKLLGPIINGNAEISIGSRYLEGSEIQKAQPLLRRAWSRSANWIVQRLLLPGIVDPHCGFKAYTEKAAKQLFAVCEVNGWSFDLEVLAFARKFHLKVAEVPVIWVNDEHSKGRLSHLPKEIASLFAIKKRMNKLG